ncbi:MAG: alpha/beta hydrolase [Paracoccaceae bacterium]|nr:alpha/beta hydrolase [Paracoccaceae bacterium]
MDAAPFRNDLAEGPEGGRAVWAGASDGVRLRAGGWPEGAKGTVLLFTGRTEYIEKYGRMARAFAEAGLATAAVDWRGQGLADRLAGDRNIGHVRRFEDYQRDVAAFLDAVQALKFPRPYHFLGHSMGGAIGLRAISEGLEVRSAVFSAPMWGINLPGWLTPFAGAIIETSHHLGLGLAYAPGTGPRPYPFRQAFKGNELTHDPESYDWLRAHIRGEPGFGLGGPSMNWIREAFAEFRHLRSIADVPCPALAMVGSDEAVVVPGAVHQIVGRWPTGRSVTLPGARHEPMMELPAIRADFTERAIAHFLES